MAKVIKWLVCCEYNVSNVFIPKRVPGIAVGGLADCLVKKFNRYLKKGKLNCGNV